MTLVNIELRLPDGTPASGMVIFSPTKRVHVEENGDDYYILPAPVARRLVEGRASIELRPTEYGWAWNAVEKVRGGSRRTVLVPDVESIDYGDLEDVEPKTLEPTAEPEAAWWAAVDDLILGGQGPDGAALVAHINSEEPHPEYDDLPSLTLQFENGLL